jgi:hypothetical protein
MDRLMSAAPIRSGAPRTALDHRRQIRAQDVKHRDHADDQAEFVDLIDPNATILRTPVIIGLLVRQG